jgi:Ni,Fe-hydrogenase I cytochrome b subunit
MKRDAEALTAIVQAESSARVRMRHWVVAISGAVLGSIATFAALKALAAP